MLRSIATGIFTRIRALFTWWMKDIQGRKSTAGKAASIGIGLFAFCCFCSTGVGIVRGTGQAVGIIATNTPKPAATSTPRPTSTPEATNTPKPTNTPEATDTPVPSATPEATSTPEATDTPPPPTDEPTIVPTDEPTPKITEAEQQAIATIADHVSDIGAALGEIGTLAQNYENTDSWKVDMAVQIVEVRSAHQALLALKVPPKIGALRASVLNATADCNAAMDSLVTGLDKDSSRDIQRATELMQSCGAKIQEVQPELDALKE